MSASGTLYTFSEHFRAYKALIAAQYSGAAIKVDSGYEHGVSNKTDAFLAKFPLGKVPAFETTEGEFIFEADAIAYAVANEQLRGKTVVDQAHVMQWISFAQTELLPASTTWVFPCLGLIPFNKSNFESAKADIIKHMTLLNAHLLTRTYLVGERITLADITMACTFLRLYEHILDGEFRAPYKNVNRWFTTMVNQPQFKAVIGSFKMCEKMMVFDNKKFSEMQAKLFGDSKKGGKKEQKPKEKKEKAAPKEKVVEAAAPAPPKPKDPLDILPAGNFDMDDFKRFYSNNKPALSVPYFWEKFDKENYSIWFGEYTMLKDLAGSKMFMTCNLVNGMFQRLVKLNKNAFAAVGVFGDDKDNCISGVWVFRGHELAFKLCDDWGVDYESYAWRKLDPNTDETKRLVDQYFKIVDEGHTFTDAKGRVFKEDKVFK